MSLHTEQESFSSEFSGPNEYDEPVLVEEETFDSLTNNTVSPIKYIAQFHTTNWYCEKERGKTLDANCLKFELDHLYLKREYMKVVELIFDSIGMHEIKDHHDDLLSFIFHDDSVASFIKMFRLLKVPVVVRREIIDTFLRCLVKILDKLSGKEYVVIKYLNAIEYEIIRKNNSLPKSQKFSKSHVASFLTQVWEYKARSLIHFMKTTQLNKYLLTQCIGLLQRCIHIKESLLFLISEEIKKKGDVMFNEHGVDIRFKFTVIDTCYQTNVRSYSFWKIIAECYSLLGIDACARKCDFFATSLTRCFSLFTHLQTKKAYTKEKISTHIIEKDIPLDSSYLNKEIFKTKDEIPTEVKKLVILDETDDNIFEFDKKFVDIYINNTKTVYSILSEQRGMKPTESFDENLPSREGDDETPRTFDASQL